MRRKIKSVLSLSLALAMCMSLMVGGVSPAYAAAPARPTSDLTTNTTSNKDVEVIVTVDADTKKVYYTTSDTTIADPSAVADDKWTEINAGTDGTYKHTITTEGTTYVAYRAENAGGEKSYSDIVYKVTITKPVKPLQLPGTNLTSQTTYTKSALTVTIATPVDVNLKTEYTLLSAGTTVGDTTEWKVGTEVTVDKEGAYDLYYRVTDTVKNVAVQSNALRIYYDATAPAAPTVVTSASIVNGNLSGSATITAVEDKNGSPIQNMYYSIDGGNYIAVNGKAVTVNLGKEGKYTVKAYAVDACGNVGAELNKEVEVNLNGIIDTPSPLLVTCLDKTPSNTMIRYKLNSYNSSFVYEYKFVPHGSSGGNANWNKLSNGSVMSIAEPGEWDLQIKISYESKDNKDEDRPYTSGVVATCVIDNEAPTVFGVNGVKRTTNDSKKAPVMRLEVDATDKYSLPLQYSFDSGKTWSLLNYKDYEKTTQILAEQIQVRDNCGNITKVNFKANITVSSTTATMNEFSSYTPISGVTLNNTAITVGYMHGYGDNKFGPDDSIKRSEMATIFNRVFNFRGGSYGTSQVTYKDLPTNHWAYQYLMNIQAYDMLDTIGGNILPNEAMTREEVAHAICQFMDLDDFISGDENPYTDIGRSYYKADILKVTAAGIMYGYGESKFGPEDTLTRAQICTIINRMIGVEDSAATFGRQFDDVPTTHWAYQDIMKASS